MCDGDIVVGDRVGPPHYCCYIRRDTPIPFGTGGRTQLGRQNWDIYFFRYFWSTQVEVLPAQWTRGVWGSGELPEQAEGSLDRLYPMRRELRLELRGRLVFKGEIGGSLVM